MEIKGNAADGFESIEKLFAHEMRVMLEDNAQLCVYHKGEKVVDLWASSSTDTAFGADSLINVFSSGKSLECIALASLVSRGLLNYDDKIADHWQAFAQQNKASITVADLMRHEAGLASFHVPMAVEDLHRDSIRQNRVGVVIEGLKARFPQRFGGRREYHAVTRGWVANELFRRVDPAERTIGEYFEEDVSGPLSADVLIAVPREQLPRISPVVTVGIGRQLWESLKPRFLGRGIVHNIFQLLGRLLRFVPALRRSVSAGATPPFKGMRSIEFFNNHGLAMGETPSANATCSARGLARLAAMMANGGSLDGHACMSPEAWQSLHDEPEWDDMGGLLPTRFTQGGVAQFLPSTADTGPLEHAFNDGREGFYGWMGLGGSVFQWHPALQVGFAFVPTRLHTLDLFNERGKRYQAEVLRCVSQLRDSAGRD